MSKAAQQTFELENRVQSLPPTDAVFHYDADEQKRLQNEAPWKQDPHFFKSVKISAVALVKMVTHARSGDTIEVMGLMQGKVTAQGEIIIMDCFALPVEGTETRVNAGEEAYEYMIQFGEASKQIGRLENAVGWYHSHPGYGCWLSGIDVGTQSNYQTYQDPFLAVVVDPNRTLTAGAVEIGAFRTYPENYTPPDAKSEYQSIPLDKIEDFGVHASRYYPLEISYFKSSLDVKLLEALWNKYWVTTLSQSPLANNRAYNTERLVDLNSKLSKIKDKTSRSDDFSMMTSAALANKGQQDVDSLEKLAVEFKAIETSEKQGLRAVELKSQLLTLQ